MKKQILVGLVAFGVVVSAFAQLTIPTRTQDGLSALARDASVVQEQSQIPDQDNRVGYLVAKYDFSLDGGSGNVDLGAALPKGVTVTKGVAQVITPILPVTSTNALSLQNAGDLLAAGTTLHSAGIKTLAPGATTVSSASLVYTDGASAVQTQTVVTATSVAAPVLVTNTAENVTFAVTGSAATQGVVFVYLDLLYTQP